MDPILCLSFISILTLSSNLYLSLPSGLFPSGFLTKILYEFFISAMHTTCLGHLIYLDLIKIYHFNFSKVISTKNVMYEEVL